MKKGDIILFGEDIYKVCHFLGFYLENQKKGGHLSNSEIFSKLGITNRVQFVQDIVGYTAEGDFPAVRTLEDLQKVTDSLRALENPENYSIC